MKIIATFRQYKSFIWKGFYYEIFVAFNIIQTVQSNDVFVQKNIGHRAPYYLKRTHQALPMRPIKA